ncbi:hypothetical protein [Mangrovactinospora gilvigrisea]|uniref:hypothetical protein n=1 Tax=Mangrovactinospora gilvigrisea TaxID=1428644 RepID=UPI0009A0C258|nr:hypothetical protein [Mangrovactinospora gilvigrisea]
MLVLVPSTAWATGGFGKRGSVSSQSPAPSGAKGTSGPDGDLGAYAWNVNYDTSKDKTGVGAGPVTPVANYTPPACWYAPTWDAKGYKKYAEDSYNGEHNDPHGAGSDLIQDGNGKDPYHLKEQDKGYWWYGHIDQSQLNSPNIGDCNAKPFWVPKGVTPKAAESLSPEQLAQLAYAHLKVPPTRVTLNPAMLQTVNLPTWVWLKANRFHPMSVTASTGLLGISATTTATPVSLHLDAGTADAQLYPSSGDCPAKADGTIGTAYKPGDKGDPPCGIRYQHASTSGPFTMTATLTWKVTWTSNLAAGRHQLPSGTFRQPHDMSVQEVQTVVSGSGG